MDYLYICPSHLKDASYCTPLHPEAYTILLKQQGDTDRKVKESLVNAENNKPYSWNKFVNKITWSKPETNEAEKDADSPKDEKKNGTTYQILSAQAEALKKELVDLNHQITNFSFKNYQLNKDIYRMRINNYIQAQWTIKRQKEIHDPSFFPQAPKGELP